MTSSYEDYESLFNPDTVRLKLSAVSTFLSIFEICKGIIIERPKTFFMDGFDESGITVGKDYENNVLLLHHNKLTASLLFMKNMEVIDDDDINFFYEARTHRNEIAHETISFILWSSKLVDENILAKLIQLVDKIERWWIINFEIPLSPQLDDINIEDIDYDGIICGPMIVIKLLVDMAFGDKETQEQYLNALRERMKSSSI